MLSGTFIILAAATFFLAYFLTRKKKWENSPPGPKGLPLLGNLMQLERLQHKSYAKWAKEYGPIMRVDVLTLKQVIVSDYKMVKELFSDSAFSGRMIIPEFDFVKDGQLPRHGVINTEGRHWEELRHFTLRQLRDFGFGKSSMEDSIMLEVNEMIDSLKTRTDKPVADIKDKFFVGVVNSLWAIMSGKRMNHNDPVMVALSREANDTFNELLEKSTYLLFAPRLASLFPKLTGFTKVRNVIDNFASHFVPPMKEHLMSYEDGTQRDFIDCFIKEIKKSKDPSSPFYDKIGEDHLLAVIIDLYFAGSDTSSTTLAWMVLYLSKFPEIQRKMQDEIEKVTGNTRQVSVQDRANLPYAEAVIAETLRYSSIVPIGVQHKAMKDHEFRGYSIPKETILVSNLHYIHHDPAIWGDPENFRPERFLSPDGKTFKKHEALMPFSIGRRQCLGESLARDTLFLFATNVFQRFKMDFDTTGPDHGFEPKISFILTPKPYRVVLKDRLQ